MGTRSTSVWSKNIVCSINFNMLCNTFCDKVFVGVIPSSIKCWGTRSTLRIDRGDVTLKSIFSARWGRYHLMFWGGRSAGLFCRSAKGMGRPGFWSRRSSRAFFGLCAFGLFPFHNKLMLSCCLETSLVKRGIKQGYNRGVWDASLPSSSHCLIIMEI